MNISELKQSNFLKKEDCGPNGILVTIKEVTEENVARQGAPEEFKYCLHLAECEKPMVLNSTNGQLIADITGSRESDDWTGKKIVLYNEPGVTNLQGKVVGGIRVRAPRGKAAQSAQPVAKAQPNPEPQPDEPPDDNSDVPF